jgi:antitoxin ParD1/3/4
MNVNLGPVFDEFVSEMLDSGLYQSQSEILREGLRLLKEREEERRLRLAELRKQVTLGAKQADRGELVDGDQVFAQIRRRSGQRKRARK